MASSGPIIICEDDREDIELLEGIFTALGVPNPRRYYDEGKAILDYLRTTEEQPFVILSNIKVRGMDGLELREQIQKDDLLRKKGIPFVFLSTDARKEVVEQAYELTVQGFFEKQNTEKGVEQQIRKILDYWRDCKHPNV